MFNLIDLSEEERTLITIGCKPFFIHYKKYPELNSIHRALMKYVPKTHDLEMWVFITAAVKAIKRNLNGSLFSLRKADYTEANNICKTKISYVRCKRIVETLDKEGLITLYKGFRDLYQNLSLKSCFVINNHLRDMFDVCKLDHVKLGDEFQYIDVRDPDTKENLPLKSVEGVKEKSELVKTYDQFLEKFDIRCKSHMAYAAFKRVFARDLEHHGRWYSLGTLQTMHSYLRQDITINGYKTTELDFKQMHPRILMTLSNVYKPASWEPYADLRAIVGGSYAVARKFSKLAMMCLLNASNLTKAKAALGDIYMRDSKSADPTFSELKLSKGSINKIFDLLIEHNSEISSWFGKDMLWATLQHYDSEIAAVVIEEFIKQGKCILPWHDSFVVCARDRELLASTMRHAWFKVLGNTKNCFYDVEF